MPKIRKKSPHSAQKIAKSGYEPFSRNNFFFIFSIFFTQPHQIRLFSRVLRSLFDFVFAQRFPKSLPKGSLNLFFYVSTLSGHCDIMWRLVEQVQHKAKSSDWS